MTHEYSGVKGADRTVAHPSDGIDILKRIRVERDFYYMLLNNYMTRECIEQRLNEYLNEKGS